MRAPFRIALLALLGCSEDAAESTPEMTPTGVGGAAASGGVPSGGNGQSGAGVVGGQVSGGVGGTTAGSGGTAPEGGAGAGGAPEDPWFGYDEPYRPQFHFTAPIGWINDANGMWYWDGLYHFSYQATPDQLPSGAKSWGHAVSTDLVHWQHLSLMLDQGVNVPGEAWSGSTVVDVDNTSGLQTGENPVLVTLYTATTMGTAVAFSNDLGATWQAYENNPVAVGGPDSSTRDPHVLWHEPSGQWVCLLYEGGTTIYTSPDLLTWTKTQTIGFGFECPDFYELPIDGNQGNTKWVLSDASGAYLLGEFDGSTFTPDSNVALKIDQSTDYYAAQTFYRETLPDTRVINMAWLRGDTELTAPWNQSITFPSEVRLQTFPEGLRVTRAPVAEIEALYEEQPTLLGPTDAAQGVNPLAGLEGRSFDLELVVDLEATTANTLDVELANGSFQIDLAGMTFAGAPISAIAGELTIRVLRDWGQYSVHVNGGETSFTKAFGFTPGDGSLSLTGDGSVALVSARFQPVARAWPGQAAATSELVDDTSARFTYTGDWTTADEDRYFDNRCSVAHAAGDELSLEFEGTRLDWYGLRNVDLGRADVYIDDQLMAEGIELYSGRRENALLFTITDLAPGTHELRVTVRDDKNADSAGFALVHDYAVVYSDE